MLLAPIAPPYRPEREREREEEDFERTNERTGVASSHEQVCWLAVQTFIAFIISSRSVSRLEEHKFLWR